MSIPAAPACAALLAALPVPSIRTRTAPHRSPIPTSAPPSSAATAKRDPWWGRRFRLPLLSSPTQALVRPPRHNQLLVGAQRQHRHPPSVHRYHPIPCPGVLLRIQFDPQKLQPRAASLPQSRRVLADPTGEGHGLDSAHRRRIRPNRIIPLVTDPFPAGEFARKVSEATESKLSSQTGDPGRGWDYLRDALAYAHKLWR